MRDHCDYSDDDLPRRDDPPLTGWGAFWWAVCMLLLAGFSVFTSIGFVLWMWASWGDSLLAAMGAF